MCASVGWQSNDMAGQAERAPGENGIKKQTKNNRVGGRNRSREKCSFTAVTLADAPVR